MFVDGHFHSGRFTHRGGDYKIKSRNNRIKIKGGKGDDRIEVRRVGQDAYSVNVNGKEHILNREEMSKLKIKGGKGNDTIIIHPGVDVGVNVKGGKGNDKIINYADGSKIKGGKGNDYIENHSDGSKIKGGKHNDTIWNQGDGNKIKGNRGHDKIISFGDFNKVKGGRGRDSIENYGDFNKVKGNRGRDDIYSQGDGNKVRGGWGRDNVQNFGSAGFGGWNNIGNMAYNDMAFFQTLNNFGYGQMCQCPMSYPWNNMAFVGGAASWSFGIGLNFNF